MMSRLILRARRVHETGDRGAVRSAVGNLAFLLLVVGGLILVLSAFTVPVVNRFARNVAQLWARGFASAEHHWAGNVANHVNGVTSGARWLPLVIGLVVLVLIAFTQRGEGDDKGKRSFLAAVIVAGVLMLFFYVPQTAEQFFHGLSWAGSQFDAFLASVLR